ncbi:hypothetical protein AB6A40_000077 [Gnathostoma spinigerum]|uniref:Uncharacterized protein n=1 Tax=Gnathostoma spinigerum TaxID=75299 RepID=A0ABD6E1G6_9BILA
MSWFKKSDPKKNLRDNNRALRRTNREIGHDRKELERREEELKLEIKKCAKSGRLDACAPLAKQLLQIRKQKTQNVTLSAKISSLNAQNTHMYSIGKMASAMGKTAQTMTTVEKQMPADKVVKQMQEFVAAQERFGVTDEMVNESLDAMLDEPEDEEEQRAIINQVLDEIGIDINAQLSKVPSIPSSTGAGVREASNPLSNEDIEKMLANLRA